uniref:ISXO2-like transposase domain-containing protein n=1 Tax=Anopheles atroparvus TaxID=41427 RepID=A0A182JKU8_ANOAO
MPPALMVLGGHARHHLAIDIGALSAKAKQSLAQLLLATYLRANNVSPVTAAAELDVHINTIRKWYKMLREQNMDFLDANRGMIGGPGLTVEVDETVITKRKANRGQVSDNNQSFIVTVRSESNTLSLSSSAILATWPSQ